MTVVTSLLISSALVGLLQPATGQDVIMKLDPKTFLPSVTPSVTLSCSLTSHNVLLMQIKKIVVQNSQENTPQKRKKGTDKTEVTSSKPVTTEHLLATVTSATSATVNLADADEKKRLKVKGAITPAGSNLTLTMERLRSEDAGLYICHATALDAQYHVTIFTAASNLTIIADEGSARLLLAKEQILETEQRHLAEEQLALHEELRQNLQDRGRLEARVKVLEDQMQNLGGVPRTAAPPPPSRGQKKGEQDWDKKLAGVSSRLDHLEGVVVSDLASTLKDLKSNMAASVQRRLKPLEDRVASLELEKDLKSEVTARPVFVQAPADDRIDDIIKRLGDLEKKVKVEISPKVANLQNDDIKALKDKLDRLQGETIKTLTDRVTELANKQTQLFVQLLQVRSLLQMGSSQAVEPEQQQTQPQSDQHSVLVPDVVRLSDTSCYVCGSKEDTVPCTVRELQDAVSELCPVGAELCLNQVVQRGRARDIYKRCASRDECRALNNAGMGQCAHYNFMSAGNFGCNFCCTSDKCNYDYKPKRDPFKG